MRAKEDLAGVARRRSSLRATDQSGARVDGSTLDNQADKRSQGNEKEKQRQRAHGDEHIEQAQGWKKHGCWSFTRLLVASNAYLFREGEGL
jgi:hypothetical protein